METWLSREREQRFFHKYFVGVRKVGKSEMPVVVVVCSSRVLAV